MRAAVTTRYGPPEVVHVMDVPRPAPEPDELLVRVHASTVNRTDCGFRAAHPWFIRGFTGMTNPKRTILGNEFAGVVEVVGKDVSRFAVGDRVFGFDGTRFGGHAEYLTIGQDAAVATMPEDRDFEVMAPATEGSHYALAYIRAAGVADGSEVLVYGATGAIGSAAVQILKSLGAQVTAVCSREHVDLVAGLGADRVIDRTTTDFVTDTQRYDLVFDAVGKVLVPAVPKAAQATRDLDVDRPRPVLAEPAARGGDPLLTRASGAVPLADDRSVDGRVPRGTRRVAAVHARRRPHLPTRADRRGVPVRGDAAEDRQRRDHRRR